MTEKRTVTASVPANKDKGTPALGPVSITVVDGSTAAEQIQMFGDEAVKTNSSSNWDTTLQASIRSGLKRGETQEQIQARMAGAKMGVSIKGAKVDAEQAFYAKFAASTPEEQAKMIEELRSRANSLRGGAKAAK